MVQPRLSDKQHYYIIFIDTLRKCWSHDCNEPSNKINNRNNSVWFLEKIKTCAPLKPPDC